jgi:hypothetical protein
MPFTASIYNSDYFSNSQYVVKRSMPLIYIVNNIFYATKFNKFSIEINNIEPHKYYMIEYNKFYANKDVSISDFIKGTYRFNSHIGSDLSLSDIGTMGIEFENNDFENATLHTYGDLSGYYNQIPSGQIFTCSNFTNNNPALGIDDINISSLGVGIAKDQVFGFPGNLLETKNVFSNGSVFNINNNSSSINYFSSGGIYNPNRTKGVFQISIPPSINYCLTNNLKFSGFAENSKDLNMGSKLFKLAVSRDLDLPIEYKDSLVSKLHEFSDYEIQTDTLLSTAICRGDVIKEILNSVIYNDRKIKNLSDINSYIDLKENFYKNLNPFDKIFNQKDIFLYTNQKMKNNFTNMMFNEKFLALSIGETNVSPESVLEITDRYNNVFGDYIASDILIKNQNYDHAIEIMSNLDKKYILNMSERLDMNNTIELFKIIKNVKESNQSFNQLSDDILDNLTTIKNKNTFFASRIACKYLDLNSKECSNRRLGLKKSYNSFQNKETTYKVDISPNPVSNEFSICANFEIKKIKIISQNGKIILEKIYDTGGFMVEVESNMLPEGSYSIEIEDGKGNVYFKRILKQ